MGAHAARHDSAGTRERRPVHNRPDNRPCRCGTRHDQDADALGTPLDPDTYDYEAAVLWNAHTGPLWRRFTIYLRREIAKRAGLTQRTFRQHARVALYHPTFLYESLWDLGVMALLLLLDRRYRLRRGRLFACYVLAYTAGRAWIEALRIDHANHFLGLRLNDWVSAILFAGALVYLLVTARRPQAEQPDPAGDGISQPSDAAPATAPEPDAGHSRQEQADDAGESPSPSPSPTDTSTDRTSSAADAAREDRSRL